jgi:hypothetical protein
LFFVVKSMVNLDKIIRFAPPFKVNAL